jgi:hypothetical protein
MARHKEDDAPLRRARLSDVPHLSGNHSKQSQPSVTHLVNSGAPLFCFQAPNSVESRLPMPSYSDLSMGKSLEHSSLHLYNTRIIYHSQRSFVTISSLVCTHAFSTWL